VIFIILFAEAFIASPSYALHNSPVDSVLRLPESEGRFNEGVRDMVNSVESCSSVLAGGFYVFTINNYLPERASEVQESPECVVKGIEDGMSNERAEAYLASHNCTLKDTITKNGKDLIEIYSC